MLDILAVAVGTEQAAKAVGVFASSIEQAVLSGVRTFDLLKNRRETSRLKGVMSMLIKLEWGQAPLPRMLRRYYETREIAYWVSATRLLPILTGQVAKLVEILSKEMALVLRIADAYESLIQELKRSEKAIADYLVRKKDR